MFTAWGRWPRLTPKPPTERVEPLLLELELLTWVSVKLLSITTPDQLIPFRLKYWTMAKKPPPTTMTTITIRNILFCIIKNYIIASPSAADMNLNIFPPQTSQVPFAEYLPLSFL